MQLYPYAFRSLGTGPDTLDRQPDLAVRMA